MTLAQVFSELTLAFKNFEDPQLEARHLLLEALKIDLNYLVLRRETEVAQLDLDRIKSWREQRLQGMPLAYLSGRKSFYKSEFIVKPGVLVPRPETEFVVETALNLKNNARKIADLGCGSGCIGLSLLKELPQAQLVSVDISEVAIEVTRENARSLGLSERATVVQSDVEKWSPETEFDLVVGNPPYIARGDAQVQTSVHRFEPHEALYAADQGLAALRNWSTKAWQHLRPDGVIVFEFGSGQSRSVQEIMSKSGFQNIQIVKDLNGIERVAAGTKAEKPYG